MTYSPHSSTVASFLIEPAALLSHQEGMLLIDTRAPEYYAEGHIPGAINLSTYDYSVKSTSEIGLNRFHREISGLYSKAGITPAQPVVVYEEQTGMRAAREAWILQYLGHPDVRLLHSGLMGWRQIGGALVTTAREAPQSAFTATPQPELLSSVAGILAHTGSPGVAILDVREHEEYTGEDGAACCSRQGRIPDATWMEWTAFLDERTGRFKSETDILRMLADRGVSPGHEIITYCHRGARAAVAYYALRYAGCRHVRNFIGSWHEWAARNDVPIQTGWEWEG